MFLCDPCHERSGCTFVHLYRSQCPCESCGTWAVHLECSGERVELAPATVDEIRANLLCHLNELAQTARSCDSRMLRTFMAQIGCAKHMCRLAGVPETSISKVDVFLSKLPEFVPAPDGMPRSMIL